MNQCEDPGFRLVESVFDVLFAQNAEGNGNAMAFVVASMCMLAAHDTERPVTCFRDAFVASLDAHLKAFATNTIRFVVGRSSNDRSEVMLFPHTPPSNLN